MKKIVALCMMMIALGFVTVGCGGGSKPAKAPAPPEVETPAQPEAETPAPPVAE